MKEFTKYFSELSNLCNRLSETHKELDLDKENDATEVMTLTYLKLTITNTKSISLLLENDLYIPTILICRNIFEAFFNLHWVFEPKDRNDQKERVYKLEGEPYFFFEKELEKMEEGLRKGITIWKKEVIENLREITSQEKDYFPHLVTNDSKGNLIFKTPPSLTKRMGEYLRLKFYHIYRFSSFFTHPTPKLKEFLQNKSVNEQTPLELIGEPLTKMYTSIIYFTFSIMGYSKALFNERTQKYSEEQKSILSEAEKIVEKTHEKYFGLNFKELR